LGHVSKHVEMVAEIVEIMHGQVRIAL
jgi:hypothetical protein